MARAKSLQLWTLCLPMGLSVMSSVHGVLQARMLEWVAVPSSRGSSQGSNLHLFVSCIGSRVLYHQCHLEQHVIEFWICIQYENLFGQLNSLTFNVIITMIGLESAILLICLSLFLLLLLFLLSFHLLSQSSSVLVYHFISSFNFLTIPLFFFNGCYTDLSKGTVCIVNCLHSIFN